MRIFKEIMRILKPNSKLLIDITDGAYMRESFQPRSWEWIDKTILFAENDHCLKIRKGWFPEK